MVKASYTNVIWSDKPLLHIIILIIRLLGTGRKYILMEDGPWETAPTNGSPRPRVLKARVHDYRMQIT